tara:strand:- start:2 stop:364 length:363 start_codon:yes stop_codon:yes gene_type:complete
MKLFKYFIIFFLIFNFNLLKAESSKQIKITKNLRCLICQGQSVHDSDTEFANSIKIIVKQKLDKGLSEREIYNFFEDKYGMWILYDPRFEKNTYFLWLLPVLFFLIGGVIIFKLFIKRKN